LITATNDSRIAYLIEATILLLMAMGTVFVFSAGANVSTNYAIRHFYQFTTLKQLFFFPAAVVVLYSVSRIDYRRLSFTYRGPRLSLAPYILGLATILLAFVLLFGVEKYEARRWLAIPIGPASVSFQPSELAKWAMVIFLAAFLDYFADTIHLFWKRFVPVCLIAGVIVALIVSQDFGTAAFIALLTFIMLLLGGARWWHFFVPAFAAGPVFWAAVMTSATRINRIKAFFSPELASASSMYQARQSLIAIAGGRMWGRGLGMGVSKYGHLPEDTTDFIFAVIAEELGFAGAVFVIFLFAVLVLLGLIVAMRCRDRFGKLLAAGIILAIGIQAAINIGVVTVVLPTKGIPLPFISAGGTSMLLCAAAGGVLANIARQTPAQQMVARLETIRHMTHAAKDENDLPTLQRTPTMLLGRL